MTLGCCWKTEEYPEETVAFTGTPKGSAPQKHILHIFTFSRLSEMVRRLALETAHIYSVNCESMLNCCPMRASNVDTALGEVSFYLSSALVA
jgi:hypothetical protein